MKEEFVNGGRALFNATPNEAFWQGTRLAVAEFRVFPDKPEDRYHFANFFDIRWGSICNVDVRAYNSLALGSTAVFTENAMWFLFEAHTQFTMQDQPTLHIDEDLEADVFLYRIPFIRGDAEAMFGPPKFGQTDLDEASD